MTKSPIADSGFQNTMRCLFGAFLVVYVLAGTSFAGANQEAPGNKHVLNGVPYISWNQALQWDYPEKDIINPALPATLSMIVTYWDPGLQESLIANLDIPTDWFSEQKIGENLDELKSLINGGIPIWLGPMPLTPVAHPLYSIFAMLSIVNEDLDDPATGLCSWMPGKMTSLNWLRQYQRSGGESASNPLGEVVHFSARVMVGYDDEREVVILHDPTFGPGWEVSYETFTEMWQAADRVYMVAHPPDVSDALARRKESKSYRERTPDERAAFHLLYGCGLSTEGRLVEAEEQFSKGVAIAGISEGYHHIILFELARHQSANGKLDAAIASTIETIDLLPENYYPWEYLAELYSGKGTGEQAEKAAAKARKKAKKLKKKKSAMRTVARVLPSDFWIPALSNERGWGLAKSPISSQ